MRLEGWHLHHRRREVDSDDLDALVPQRLVHPEACERMAIHLRHIQRPRPQTHTVKPNAYASARRERGAAPGPGQSSSSVSPGFRSNLRGGGGVLSAAARAAAPPMCPGGWGATRTPRQGVAWIVRSVPGQGVAHRRAVCLLHPRLHDLAEHAVAGKGEVQRDLRARSSSQRQNERICGRLACWRLQFHPVLGLGRVAGHTRLQGPAPKMRSCWVWTHVFDEQLMRGSQCHPESCRTESPSPQRQRFPG